MSISYVYVIASSEEGPVKIGRSIDPAARCKQLQTGHQAELKVYHQQAFDEKLTPLVERTIHKTLYHKRLKGEWFQMPVETAILEVTYAEIMHGS